jgi:hypothetical protein
MTPTNPTLTMDSMTEQVIIDRPEFVKNVYLKYLNAVRESGLTNMFGAVPYLVCEFPELDKRQARAVLSYWMRTFTP